MQRDAVRTQFSEAPVRISAVLVLGTAISVLVGVDGSLGWRFVRVLLVVACALGVLRLMVDDRRRAGLAAMAFGVAGLVVGIGIGVRFASIAGLVWRSVVGIVAFSAGLVLVVAGFRTTVTGFGRWRKVASTVATAVMVLVIVWVLLPGVVATNVPPTELGAARLTDHGVAARDVQYTADDGTVLSAWYVSSSNGAAVVLRHGAGSTRTSVIPQALVLAAHGYGVLLTDARGHGLSGLVVHLPPRRRRRDGR